MKALFSLLILALVSVSAQGAKVDSRQRTCRDVSGIVDEKKSAVIYFDKNRFDLFFAHSGICEDRQSLPAYLPTLDNPRCFVGYSCGYVRADRGGGGISVIGASSPIPPAR